MNFLEWKYAAVSILQYNLCILNPGCLFKTQIVSMHVFITNALLHKLNDYNT